MRRFHVVEATRRPGGVRMGRAAAEAESGTERGLMVASASAGVELVGATIETRVGTRLGLDRDERRADGGPGN